MASIRKDNAAQEDTPLILGAASSSIVMTLAYFSLFRHPLTEEELLTHAHFHAISREDGRSAIRTLVDRGIVESINGLLCLQGESDLVHARAERVARAVPWHKQAEHSVRVLSRLPFLRGLFISGSLSKGTQDPDGDIDFLVLTAPNRLWTVRFFASILLKAMRRAHRRNFCLNYFLPEDQLEIRDHTLFSATEVAFLKPVLNDKICTAFFEQNGWVRPFYPNWQPPTGPAPAPHPSYFQRLLEWPLAGFLGNLFESRISRWYFNRLERVWAQLPSGQSKTDARFGPREFKGHTRGRHDWVRQRWADRLDAVEADLGISLIRQPWALALASGPSAHRTNRHRNEDRASQPVLPLKLTGRRLLPIR